MNPFSFMGSNEVSFGLNRVEQLADDIAGLDPKSSQIMVIGDVGIARAGILDRIRSILAWSEYDVTVFSELTGEPQAAVIDQVAAVLRRLDHPVVVGVGGGSALDVAKLAAVIAKDTILAEDYALCARPLPQPGLKRILIPTTAGTGSEVTRTAVFTTCKENKVWAWGHELLPEMVLLDPSLTVSLPAEITAATGLDAMVHAIEACTCQNRNPMADALGLHAIRLAGRHLLDAIEKPADIEARSGMLVASTLAGFSFAQTGTGGAHAIGHALATIAGIPHGRAVTIGMEAILPWNAAAYPEAHAAVAQALGGERKADQCDPAFKALVDQAGIDRSLSDSGIEPEDLARVMMSPENLPMIQNNARLISAHDAIELARWILIK
ncbi:MAG: iron-containing alcohol dehydrogenase [Desulfobacterales bacterium]|jgi:alcohol dehydrogenase class IV